MCLYVLSSVCLYKRYVWESDSIVVAQFFLEPVGQVHGCIGKNRNYFDSPKEVITNVQYLLKDVWQLGRGSGFEISDVPERGDL